MCPPKRLIFVRLRRYNLAFTCEASSFLIADIVLCSFHVSDVFIVDALAILSSIMRTGLLAVIFLFLERWRHCQALTQTSFRPQHHRLTQRAPPPALFATERTHTTRAVFLATCVASVTFPGHAFDGGVGGLGKTRPETGVLFFPGSSPFQNADGLVTAELVTAGASNQPYRVSFRTPWPLLPTTTGLESRDLQTSESAFVQVLENTPLPTSTANFATLVQNSVLASQGKFGAYGSPTDVKVKRLDSAVGTGLTYSVRFVALTPGQRESERQLLIRCVPIADSLVLLLAGTTRQRFATQQGTLRDIIDSLEVVPTPVRPLR